ncbi:MAG: integrase core domain-containing protein [candidate division NC10 bacterium]|nr:integrase core domain-containing protein [candidate division NC10 bacterium]MDE2322585.1 integrase core domain-containing protein [candidate division NC10 bacterium]
MVTPFRVLRAGPTGVILAWIDRYNTERHHSALGYLASRAWRECFYQLPQAA